MKNSVTCAPGPRGSATGAFSCAALATLDPHRHRCAIDIGAIIGGLIITERIFENKGMGDFFLTAYENGDFPQLMPWMVFVVLGVILANLFADVLYAVLDPRIRLD